MLDSRNTKSCPKVQTLSRYLDKTILVKIKASVARMCKQLVVAIEVVDAVEDGSPSATSWPTPHASELHLVVRIGFALKSDSVVWKSAHKSYSRRLWKNQ